MAAWILVPDKLDDKGESRPPRFGAFGTTVITFFLAEMGDKTQIATVMLAARFPNWVAVVAGTTTGMLIADVPAVWFGDKVTKLVSIRVVHVVSALVFLGLGLAALFV
jgi:Ca2+/H+ antiporter, TMEM165/GDT1 family